MHRASPLPDHVDEAIMSAAFCCALALLLPLFSRSSKSSIDELAQRMIEYTAKMDAEHSATRSEQLRVARRINAG